MNIEQKNRLQLLEDKVKDLERKLEEKTSKKEMNLETQARLGSYQDNIRSEQGKIFLKKNFEIKNRKAIAGPNFYEGLNPTVDNVVTLSFNNQEEGRLNHIFIGTESRAGNNNCSVISGVARHRKNAPAIPNNGRIEFSIITDEDIDSSGVKKDDVASNIMIFPMEQVVEGLEGISILLIARGNNSYSGLVHQLGSEEKYFLVNKDNFLLSSLPTSDPNIAGAIWRSGTTLKISSKTYD
jgi:hypothetical protein